MADDARREAAAHIERGIEAYATGQLDVAQKALEAALTIVPNHPRAVEALAWVRDVAAGRKTLQSGGYAAMPEEDDREISVTAPIPMPRTPTKSQLDEAPDSVTREWSSLATGHNLPQLDVPELSEDQIANLLDLDAGRGIRLSHGAGPVPPADDDDDAQDRTSVRLPEQGGNTSGEYEAAEVEHVIEFVADAEDDMSNPGLPSAKLRSIPSEPSLTPLTASSASVPMQRDDQRMRSGTIITPPGRGAISEPKLTQLGDDAPSMPTNPFVNQRLAELAGGMLPSSEGSGEANLEELPGAPTPPATTMALDAAIRRGAKKEAFDLAERLVEAMGGLDSPSLKPNLELLELAYALTVGDISLMPRIAKTTPNLDSRSAFLLSRVDGGLSIDDLLDICGMPQVEAMRVLARLITSGIIVVGK